MACNLQDRKKSEHEEYCRLKMKRSALLVLDRKDYENFYPDVNSSREEYLDHVSFEFLSIQI